MVPFSGLATVALFDPVPGLLNQKSINPRIRQRGKEVPSLKKLSWYWFTE